LIFILLNASLEIGWEERL